MKKIPDAPGVYFFLDRDKKVLYIGKATSLRDRTRSYFSPDLATTR
ncbi:MAG TPA: GIY-YIG nuclease family protein, partial [Candidatus Paceibacterota bacterium]|nr:GIY-YIG nuclease family protein [Candidatus Paceibacterota bacterium]